MMIPDQLQELIEDGVIQSVRRPLKSGKEAAVFLVVVDGELCAAKVYKAADARNFRKRADYVEGRRVGDSRQQRAMQSGSRFGQQQNEAAWQQVEADAMLRLAAAGVRVPRLHQHGNGVLLMDLVLGSDGEAAPQLAALQFSREDLLPSHGVIIRQIVRMLCEDLVHGDLSEFNILLAADGPMIIDLPQAIDAARNNQARRLLLRDVNNVTRFFARFAPQLRRTDFGQEMWLLRENSALDPDSPLTGRFKEARQHVDAEIVLREIEAAKQEAAERAEARQRGKERAAANRRR